MRKLLPVGLAVFVCLLTHLAFADEAEQVTEIQNLLKDKKLEAAEEAFAAALKESPDSPRLNTLHFQFSSAYQLAGKPLRGAEHYEEYLNYQLRLMERTPVMARSAAGIVSTVASTYLRAGNMKKGDELFDNVQKAIEKLQAEKPSPSLVSALGDLQVSKVQWLAGSQRLADAQKLLKTEFAAAEKAFADKKDDAALAVRLASLMRLKSQLSSDDTLEQRAANREKYLAFLTEQSQKHPKDILIAGEYLNGHFTVINSLAGSNPVEANKLLDTLREYVKTLESSENAALKARVTTANTTITSLARRIEGELKRLALIGKPAFPLDVEAWMNGSPLTDGDLRGKVVLLDFWAVWCGPCIATFPHLREWHEKYADKGLVIIGMTRYYQYDWDDDAKKIKKVADLEPEKERDAVLRFADHHKLKHRLAEVPKESTFYQDYLVSGIPQAVLIDQTGAIRLIKVGSGEANAKELDTLIRKLLGEPEAEVKTPAEK